MTCQADSIRNINVRLPAHLGGAERCSGSSARRCPVVSSGCFASPQFRRPGRRAAPRVRDAGPAAVSSAHTSSKAPYQRNSFEQFILRVVQGNVRIVQPERLGSQVLAGHGERRGVDVCGRERRVQQRDGLRILPLTSERDISARPQPFPQALQAPGLQRGRA